MPSNAGWASIAGGAIVTILVWALQTWTKVDMPVLVQGAVVTLATGLIAEYWPAPKPPTP